MLTALTVRLEFLRDLLARHRFSTFDEAEKYLLLALCPSQALKLFGANHPAHFFAKMYETKSVNGMADLYVPSSCLFDVVFLEEAT